MVNGETIGPYTIVGKLGEGGMGEVYRARDSQLDRDVAIKILPEAFAGDPDRLMRFEREAKTLATLNHPHIAQVHGFERSGDTPALVMELVEGDDLTERIARGPIPIDDALAIAGQIADALEAAHDRGIVHRDLKPANIKLADDGNVKVLDFGLAKAMDQGSGIGDQGSGGAADSPTLTSPAMTRAGVILGTAAYMSPEQARGRVVDKRADIWAFGVVLYEMLTARRAFDGETVSDTIAAVLTREVDLNALPRETPARVQRLLARCLTRDPRMRLRDIGEARIALAGAGADPGALSAPAPTRSSRARRWLLAGAGGATGAAIATALAFVGTSPATEAPRPVMHLSITLPPEAPLAETDGSLAISPDGTRLAYVGATREGTRLFLRELDETEFKVVPGTEGAIRPFFSPDSTWLGFTVAGRLRKVPAGGGSPVTITEVSGSPLGGVWGQDDTIVFSPSFTTGLWAVPATGGPARALISVDRARHEGALLWPQVLPGGSLLFTADSDSTASYNDAQVVVQAPGQPDTRRVLVGGTAGRYLPTGHLVFGHNARIMAAPFDLARQRLTAAAVPVLNGVAMSVINGLLHAVMSDTGVLAYVPGSLMQAPGKPGPRRPRRPCRTPEPGVPVLAHRLAPLARRSPHRRAGGESQRRHPYPRQRGGHVQPFFPGRWRRVEPGLDPRRQARCLQLLAGWQPQPLLARRRRFRRDRPAPRESERVAGVVDLAGREPARLFRDARRNRGRHLGVAVGRRPYAAATASQVIRRTTAGVLPRRRVAGVRVGRVGSPGSVRDAVSRWPRSATDLSGRRFGAALVSRWARTLLRQRRLVDGYRSRRRGDVSEAIVSARVLLARQLRPAVRRSP